MGQNDVSKEIYTYNIEMTDEVKAKYDLRQTFPPYIDACAARIHIASNTLSFRKITHIRIISNA